MRFVGIVLVVALATGCKQAAQPQQARYQIAIAASGQVYRLDATSGEVTVIEKAPTSSEGRTKLAVGSFYEIETGDVLRYVGEGKFVPRPPLSDYEIKK